MLCRMLQVPPGESLAHNMPDMRKQHRDMGMFEGASELVAVGQVSGTPSGRTSTAGDKKSTAGDILGNLLSIAFLCSTHMPLIKVIIYMFCSPATNVWCSIVTGCSRTG